MAKRSIGSGCRLGCMVSGVSRGMGVLDGNGDRRRRGTVLGLNVGHPIVTSGDCGVVTLCREGWCHGSLQITSEFLVIIISTSLYERSANGIELSLVPFVCPHM